MTKTSIMTIPSDKLEELLRINGYITHSEKFSSMALSSDNKVLVVSFDSGSILIYSDEQNKLLDTPIENLDLSVRAVNCMKASKLDNLRAIIKLTPSEIMKFRNFGQKSLSEIEDLLKTHGLSVAPEPTK